MNRNEPHSNFINNYSYFDYFPNLFHYSCKQMKTVILDFAQVRFQLYCYNIQIAPMNFSMNFIPNEQSNLPSFFQEGQSHEIREKTHTNIKALHPKRKRTIMNPYKWKSIQNTKYVNFLKSRLHLMKLPIADRKKIKINVIMSTYVKTRNPEQCRSHHQKMMLKYGTIENIIAYYPKDCKDIKSQINSKNEISSQVPLVEEMKKKLDEQVQSSQEPCWHQYLDLYSYEQSQQFAYVGDEY